MFYDYEGKILERYSKAPLEVLHHKALKDFSKLVYFELYSIYDQNKANNQYLFIKDETLADKLEVSTIYIKKSMKDLEDNHLIKRSTSAFDKSKQAKKRKIYIQPLKRNRENKVSYVTFPKSIYSDTDINNVSKIILIELISLFEVIDYESTSYGTIHVKRLADELGKHRRTVINHLNKLEEQGYIFMDGSGSERNIHIEKEKIFFSDGIPF